jgi:hypothetical protein
MYEEMLTKYSTASGSSMKENEARMESWETKINQLRNTISNFWNDSINTNFVKGIIDSLTILVSTFGNLTTVILTVVTALTLWKGAQLQKWLVSSKIASDGLRVSLIANRGAMLGLTQAEIANISATKGLTLSMNTLRLAFAANPVGIIATALLTLWTVFDIGKSVVSSYAQKQKEAFDQLTSSVKLLKQETTELPGLISSYEELSAKALLTTEEKSKLAIITEKLSSLFGDSVVKLDAEGKAIEIDIAYVKQLTEAKKELLNTQQSELGSKYQSEGKQQLSELQKKQQKIQEITKEIEDHSNQITKLENDTSGLDFSSYIEKHKNKIKELYSEKTILLGQSQEIKNTLNNEVKAFDESSNSVNKLSQSLINIVTDSISKTNSSFADMQSILSSLSNNNAGQSIQEVMNKISNGSISAEDGLSKINQVLLDNGFSAKQADVAMINFTKAITLPDAKNTSEKIKDISQALDNVDKAFKDGLSAQKDYIELQDKMRDGTALTAEELLTLMEKHEELLPYITATSDGYVIEEGALERLRLTAIQSAQDRIAEEIRLTTQAVQSSMDRINQYQFEASILSALTATSQTSIDNLKHNAVLTRSESEGVSYGEAYNLMYNAGELDKLQGSAYNYGYVNDLLKKQDLFNQALNNRVGVSKPVSVSRPSGSSGSGSSSTTEKPDVIDMTDAYIRKINSLNQLTEAKNKSLQTDLEQTKSSKDYVAILEKTNDLLSSQQTEITQLNQANSQFKAKMDEIKHVGFGAVDWLTIDGEQTETYLDQYNKSSEEVRKNMDLEFQQLSKLTKAMRENEQTIDNLNQNKKELTDSIVENKKAIVDSIIEIRDNMLDEVDKKYNKTVEDINISLEEHSKKFDEILTKSEKRIEKYNLNLSKIDFDISLLQESDYSDKTSLLDNAIDESSKKANRLETEFNHLSKTIVYSEKDADKLRSRLQELKNEMQSTNIQTIEYVKTLEQVQFNQITLEAKLAQDEIDRLTSRIDSNKNLLEDGMLSGDELLFDFELPNGNTLDFSSIINDTLNNVEDIEIKVDDSLQRQLENAEEHHKKMLAFINNYYNTATNANVEFNSGIENETNSSLDTQYSEYESFYTSLSLLIESSMKTAGETQKNYLQQMSDNVKSLNNDLTNITNNSNSSNSSSSSSSSGYRENMILGKSGNYNSNTGDYSIRNSSGVVISSGNGTYEDYKKEYKKYAKGTSNHPGGKAIVGEEGKELLVYPDGKVKLTGDNGAELVDLPKDIQVIPNKETEELLKYRSYAKGTNGYEELIEDYQEAINSVTKKISDFQLIYKDLDSKITEMQSNGVSEEDILIAVQNKDLMVNEKSFLWNDELLKAKEKSARETIDNLTKYLEDSELTEEVQNQVKEEIQNQNDIISQALEQRKQIVKNFFNYQQSLRDKDLQEFIDYQDNLDYYKTILDVNDYSRQITLSQEIINNENNRLDLLKEQQMTLESQRDEYEIGSYEWNDLNNQVKNYGELIEDVTSNLVSLNKELLNTQFNQQLKAIEKILFNGQTESEVREVLQDRIDLQNKYISGSEKDLEINKIRNQIQLENLTLTTEQTALLNTQGQIERSSLERLQKQLEIQQLQVKLKNLLNNKTIQQLTKDVNGNWDFTYVADQEAIAQTQEDLANKQVNLIKFEQDQVNEIDQEKLDEKSKYLSKLKIITDNAQNGEYANFNEFQQAMTKLNQKYLNGMVSDTAFNWSEIYSSIQTNLDSITANYSTYVTNLQVLAAQAKQAYEDILNAQKEAEEASKRPTTYYDTSTGQIVNPTAEITKYIRNAILSDTNTVLDKQKIVDDVLKKFDLKSYDNGGETQSTGLHWLDGKFGSPERVLTSEQTVSFNKLVNMLPKLDIKSILSSVDITQSIAKFIKPLDIAKNLVQKPTQSTSQVFNIDKIEFPNITSPDGIENAFDNLPLKAMQKVRVQYGQ